MSAWDIAYLVACGLAGLIAGEISWREQLKEEANERRRQGKYTMPFHDGTG